MSIGWYIYYKIIYIFNDKNMLKLKSNSW